MNRLAICPLLFLVSPILATDPPMPFSGKVVKVTDGDTIHVLPDRETHKIRLLHIDAPKSDQAFGTKAKQALSEMIFGKEVKVVWKSRGR
jgi:endonuclease YncB( thermonuclease family)